MDRKEAIAWTLSVCAALRRSQAKTLSELVAEALGMVRASLAELGRCVCARGSVAAKHCIKPVDRFVGNARIEPGASIHGSRRSSVTPSGLSKSFLGNAGNICQARAIARATL